MRAFTCRLVLLRRRVVVMYLDRRYGVLIGDGGEYVPSCGLPWSIFTISVHENTGQILAYSRHTVAHELRRVEPAQSKRNQSQINIYAELVSSLVGRHM